MIDESQLSDALEARAKRREERRRFLSGFGTFAAVGGLAMAGLATRASAQSAVSDGDVLNFALNLEYLEANFYHFAVFGRPIPDGYQGGTGTQGQAIGGRKIRFSDPTIAKYAREISSDELAHVNFLRGALGDAAVAMPQIDVSADPNGAFSTAARAAGLIGPGESFDPYSSDENFLLGAFIFEDVGVTAYKGAAPLITNPTYLEAAAGILAVEAYHASLIRTTLYTKGLDAHSLIEATQKISNARDSLDGSTDDDDGVGPVSGSDIPRIAILDSDGIAYSRTTGAVLNIAYLNSGAVSKGGFFPNGVNGSIMTSAANGAAG